MIAIADEKGACIGELSQLLFLQEDARSSLCHSSVLTVVSLTAGLNPSIITRDNGDLQYIGNIYETLDPLFIEPSMCSSFNQRSVGLFVSVVEYDSILSFSSYDPIAFDGRI